MLSFMLYTWCCVVFYCTIMFCYGFCVVLLRCYVVNVLCGKVLCCVVLYCVLMFKAMFYCYVVYCYVVSS